MTTYRRVRCHDQTLVVGQGFNFFGRYGTISSIDSVESTEPGWAAVALAPIPDHPQSITGPLTIHAAFDLGEVITE